MKEKFQVFVDPEFEQLIPPLTQPELQQLAKNIFVQGFRDRLTCWLDPETGKHLVLDGHNRLRIFQENEAGLQIQHPNSLPRWTILLNTFIRDRDHAMLWIKEHQLGRRNLNDGQRAIIWDQILEQRSKIALSQAAAKARAGKSNPVLAKTAKLEKQDNRAAVAKESKTSVSTLRSARIIRKASPDLAAEVLAGTKTFRDALRELKGKSAFPNLKIGDEVYVDARYPDSPAFKTVVALNALTIDLGDFGTYRRDNGQGENEAFRRTILKVATPEDHLRLAEDAKRKQEKEQYYAGIRERVAEVRGRFIEKGWPCEVGWENGGWSLKFSVLKTEQLEELAAALPAPALTR